MRVAIGGMGKSGTTALYHAVRAALPPETVCRFEPKVYESVAAPHELVKVLVQFDWRPYVAFDRHVLILRDPRDQFVSSLLYSVYNHPQVISPADQARLIQLVERKERDTRSVGAWDLAQELRGITGKDYLAQCRERYEQAQSSFRLWPQARRIRYEDFVAGRLGELEAYLELELPRDVQVDATLRRVERTRGAGDWRNWFTAQDIEILRPVLAGPMQELGYPDCWDLSESPQVLPQHGSEYLRRLLAEQTQRELSLAPPPQRNWRRRARDFVKAGLRAALATWTGGQRKPNARSA